MKFETPVMIQTKELDKVFRTELRERQRTNIRKGNIGFVFQSFNLIDELTVYENVELSLRISRRYCKY
jgi:ABC-type lipoprotein export system ATPase subunit